MRVLCSTIHGADVEGEVIGGERFDPVTESCDLDSIFTVRCDDGAIYQVHGWLVDVVILEKPRTFYLM